MNTLPNDLLKCFCPLLNAKTYLHLSMTCKRNLILREKKLKEAMRQRLRAVKQYYCLNIHTAKELSIVSEAPNEERDGPYVNSYSMTQFRNGQEHGPCEHWNQNGTPAEKLFYVRGKIHGIIYSYYKGCSHLMYLYEENEQIICVKLKNISEKECQRGCKYLQCIQEMRRQEQA